jgi:hypothetical protein
MALTWRLFTPAETEGNLEVDESVVRHKEETAVAIMQKILTCRLEQTNHHYLAT